MDIRFSKTELLEMFQEDVSRLAARSHTEEGLSLYDDIKLTSRDSSIVERMLTDRVAIARGFLAFCLGAKEQEGDDIVYEIIESRCPAAQSKTVIETLLRKYIVDGALLDWYARHGIASTLTADGLAVLKNRLVCTLRQGAVRRPLQPFGPRR